MIALLELVVFVAMGSRCYKLAFFVTTEYVKYMLRRHLRHLPLTDYLLQAGYMPPDQKYFAAYLVR